MSNKTMAQIDKLADWVSTRVCYAHDKVVTEEYRAFEKKFGPNGFFNFANYVLAKKPWSILFHAKLPDDLFRFIFKRKNHQGGWLA